MNRIIAIASLLLVLGIGAFAALHVPYFRVHRPYVGMKSCALPSGSGYFTAIRARGLSCRAAIDLIRSANRHTKMTEACRIFKEHGLERCHYARGSYPTGGYAYGEGGSVWWEGGA